MNKPQRSNKIKIKTKTKQKKTKKVMLKRKLKYLRSQSLFSLIGIN